MDLPDSSTPPPVTIRKSATIDLGNDRYMILVYYYRSEKSDKSRSFYKCSLRIDSMENWMKMRDSLLKDNPAQTFTTSMIGMEENHSMIHRVRPMNRTDFYRWLGSRFSERRVKTLKDFLEKEFSCVTDNSYLRKYPVEGREIDISEPGKIPEGRWFTAVREKRPRKKYGTVVQ